MLDPRAIATQGLAVSPRLVAVQGLWSSHIPPAPWVPAAGIRGPRPWRQRVPDDLVAAQRQRLIEDDELMIQMAAFVAAAGLLN